jgi:oxygen-independent coproporphyrinogen-3 oxidase
MSDDDQRRREVIVGLLCNGTVDLGDDGERYFAAELERLAPFVSEGLVSSLGRRITLADAGWPYVRAIAATFDAYLGKKERVFSVM